MAGSSQLIIMSMTSWAAPAHLALNSLWLWLFLRRRISADIAAIGVSFVATGLHQAIFHPLFAMPFLVELILCRRWFRAAGYLSMLVVITLFWLEYWRLTVGVDAEVLSTTTSGNPAFVTDRILALLADFGPSSLGLTSHNLLRFLAWQVPLTIPFALIGIRRAMAQPGPLRAMAIGVCIAPIVFMMLVPSQTHGWGYRYLHGYLGVVALLAVSGWSGLTQAIDSVSPIRSARFLATLGGASVLILLPVQAWQAHRFSQPYASAFRAIRKSVADVVLVDNLYVGFDGGGLVRNDPFLANRPKVMLLASLDASQQSELCRRASVAMIDASHPSLLGVTTWRSFPERSRQSREMFARLGCLVR
jgi:hypothetical protein